MLTTAKTFAARAAVLLVAVLLARTSRGMDQAADEGVVQAEAVLIRLIDQVEVPARTSGVLADIHVVEGQFVEQGGLMGKIDDTETQLLGQRAEIELNIARENVRDDVAVRAAEKTATFARSKHGRLLQAAQELTGSVLKSELEEAELQLEQAQLDLERAQRDLKLTQLTRELKENDLELSLRNLDLCNITAPLSGVVVEVLTRPGEWVQPGDKVARIVRLDRLRAEGFIPAPPTLEELEGLSARVSVPQRDGSGKQFAARIVFVSPEVNPVSGQVRVWAEVDNPEGLLKPGMRATMTIILGPRQVDTPFPEAKP